MVSHRILARKAGVALVAIWSRVLQFRAGPNETEFHACAKHRPQLEKDWPLDLFFSTVEEPVKAVDPDDEIECYFCREGGGE